MLTPITCICGNSSAFPTEWAVVDNISIVECACGIKRVATIDKESYQTRYESGSYHSEDRTHDTGHKAHSERFQHDFDVAVSRLDRLQRLDLSGKKLLDVGCSNGAFVAAALAGGFDARGCDLAVEAVPEDVKYYVSRGAVSDCGFLRRTYDIVTLNDVLEHLIDPLSVLRCARGLLKRTGILVIEMPDMGSRGAKELGPSFKHVKPREHLWYFTSSQLRELLEAEGFNVVWMDIPIDGKMTIYAMPSAAVEDVTIYGPPGIGDILWTLIKLYGIREREAPCRITYVVCTDGTDKLATRAKDFLLLCEYIDSCDFRPLPLPRDAGNSDPSKPIYELIANDYLEPQGKQLYEWRPELPTHWSSGITIPDCAIRQARARLRGIPLTAAFYLSSKIWNSVVAEPDWTPRHYAELFIKLSDNGVKPVIIGAGWDTDYAKDVAIEIADMGREPAKVWLNVIGRTPIALAMAYMDSAAVTIGIANGLPMLPAWAGKPTIILWPTKKISNTKVAWGTAFQTNWLPAHILRSGTYTALPIGGFSVNSLFDEIMKKINYKGCSSDEG